MFGLAAWATAISVSGCGDSGFVPSTIDPGSNFAVADVVFDENYFYCKVEPVLFKDESGQVIS